MNAQTMLLTGVGKPDLEWIKTRIETLLFYTHINFAERLANKLIPAIFELCIPHGVTIAKG